MTANALVTGASAGFGSLITLSLLRDGNRVAASMRDPQGRNAEAARRLREAGAAIVEIDVTEEGSVQRGVDAALGALGRVDVLVNNAGVGVHGLVESFTADDLRRVFDINVFGVQRMNRAVLPHMRRGGNGLVIYISSLLGRITMPFYGPYNASKWALEALAENYRTELSAFGIESAIVEPGGYPTTFMDRLVRPSDRSRDAAYGDLAHAPEASLRAFAALLQAHPAQEPQNVADAVAKLVGMKPGTRPFRTVVDSLGMGLGVEGYNAHLDELTRATYGSMGIDHMLEPRSGERRAA